jgi:hypothetical protein
MNGIFELVGLLVLALIVVYALRPLVRGGLPAYSRGALGAGCALFAIVGLLRQPTQSVFFPG